MADVKPLYMAAEGYQEEMAASATISLGGLTLTTSAGIDMNTYKITDMGDPGDPQDAATKAYVDAVASGLAIKNPALAVMLAENDGRATVAAIAVSDLGDPTTLDLTPTPDSVVLGENDRVLLTAQAPGTEDGIWVAHATGGWIRAADMAAASHAAKQFVVAAAGGTTYGLSKWICTNVAPTDVVGTDALTFVRTLYGLANVVDGISIDTDGMRVLVVDPGDTLVQAGLWVAHATAWTRPTDYASGSHSDHSFVFIEQGTDYADTGWVAITDSPTDVIDTNAIEWVQFSAAGVITAGNGLQKVGQEISVKKGDGIEVTSNGNSTNIDLATNPGLTLSGTSPNKKLAALIDANGGLQINGASGLSAKVATSPNATLSATSAGLAVLGLPEDFTIAGVATHFNDPGSGAGYGQVTSPNLDTLTAGSGSNADSLHTHTTTSSPYANTVQNSLAVAAAVAVGDPLYLTSTNDTVGKATANDDAKSRVIGVSVDGQATPGDPTKVCSIGPVSVGTGPLTGATVGAPIYLAATGGLTKDIPTGGNRIIRVGIKQDASVLFVMVVDYGKKAA